jgi:hypothetical protein
MASPLSILVTTVATAVGLKAAGKIVPPLAAYETGSEILREIDDKMKRSAAEAVLDANQNSNGTRPNIVLLDFYNGSQTKADLRRFVEKQGGTAWFQTGANRRIQAYWHHSKAFQPKEAKDCFLGHVVHGSKDGI